MIPGLFNDPTSRTLRTALTGLQRRQQVIADNVANVDTPNFKAREVVFEDALAKELGTTEKRAPKLIALGLDTTHERHIPLARKVESFKAVPTTLESTDGTLRNDGNTVDVERQMTRLAETQLLYNALGQVTAGKLGTLRSAINEGRR